MKQTNTPNVYEDTRKDGTRVWRVMLSFRDPDTRARKQKMVTYYSKKEALDALAQNRANASRGDDAPPPTMTVGELLNEWLERQRTHVRELTYDAYMRTVRLHLLPQLGTLRLAALTPRRIEQHYAALRAAGVGHWAIVHAHERLCQVTLYARKQRLIQVNPTENVTKPRAERSTRTIWTDAEITRFLRVAESSPYGPIWLVALRTGMRRGELLGLRWEDVDEAARVLHVRQQITRKAGPNIARSPKMGSVRTISVGPSVFRALRAHQTQQKAQRLRKGPLWQEHGLVFTSDCGTAIEQRCLRDDLKRLIAQAGVPDLRIHDLRHTHASQLLRHGKGVHEVSARLGHAHSSITLNVYSHAIPDEHNQTALDLDSWHEAQGG